MDPSSNGFPTAPSERDHDNATEVTSQRSFQQHDQPLDSTAGDNGVQGVTGPVGEPGLPPPRPVSLAGPSSQQNQGSGANRTRVGDVSGQMHAPLASRAFYTPMSSQRLQAYRGHRPVSHVVRRSSLDSMVSQKINTRRNSFASGTMRGGTVRGSQDDISLARPPSRGSEYTDWTAHGATDGISAVDGTSVGGSFAPGHQRFTSQERPPPIDPEKMEQLNNQQKAHRSPRSPHNFISNLRRTSRHSFQMPWQKFGQEKLESAESTPTKQQSLEVQRHAKKDLGKNYEYFSGNTKFFWGGRLQTTRDKPIAIFTGACVVIPCILFFVFSAPFLWHHVSAAVPIFFAIFFYITFSSYLHAALSNPGIYPRNVHPQPPVDPYMDAELPTSEWILVRSDVAVYGAYEVPVKYCKTCNIWRPPRCHHCRVCDSCIDTQDHHCMWLNNCVGRRNYRYFFTFVASGAVLGVYLLGASIGHIAKWQKWKNEDPGDHGYYTFADAIDQNRVPMAMFIYGILAFLYPGALTVYHVVLMIRGQTTREYINSNKFNKEDRHRPFNQSHWWRNIIVVLCRPRPPTYLHFKRRYEEGDQRFGARKGHRITPLAPQQQGGGGMEMQQLAGSSNMHGVTVPFQGPTGRGPIVDRTPRDEEFEISSQV